MLIPRERSRPQVLLVEDDPDSAEAIRLLLDYEGYTVAWLATGAEALARLDGPSLDAPPPVAILLDLGLPDMSSPILEREVARRAARIPPVVVLSAAPEPTIRRVAAAMGAFAALRKPCDADALLATLARIAARRDGPMGGPASSRPALARPTGPGLNH